MSFHIDDEKLLEKYKAIWNKIEDLRENKQKQFVLRNAFNAYNVEVPRHFVPQGLDIVKNLSCMILENYQKKFKYQKIFKTIQHKNS